MKKIVSLILILVYITSFSSFAENENTVDINKNTITISGKSEDYKRGNFVGYTIYTSVTEKTFENILTMDDMKIKKDGEFSFEPVILDLKDAIKQYLITVNANHVNTDKIITIVKPDFDNEPDKISEAVKVVISSENGKSLVLPLAVYSSCDTNSDVYKSIVDKGGENDFLGELITKIGNVTTTTEFKKSFDDVLMTNFVKLSLGSEIEKYLKEYFNLFTDSEFNISDYNKLSVSNQNKIFQDIAGRKFDNRNAVIVELNSLIKKYSYTPPSGGSGGNSSGGNGSITYPVGTPKPTVKPSPKPEITYHDVEASHWAYEAIKEMSELGIINGYSDGRFGASERITRAEFVKMVNRAFDVKDTSSEENKFTDVSEEDWFYGDIMKAYSNKIINGNGNKFSPNENITREDMAVILSRVVKEEVVMVDLNFADSEEISEYAKTAVAYFAKKGIVNGKENNKFAPKDYATRAEATMMIYNIIKN